ncbi:MAG: HD-GYP domain-containing protein [Spirochaetaceae bacterium]|jgi:HD-GYP domain-containing protein (c-di-GMP phosphodiesterase class II)|nr:HD-GYP domain-containing protein [Spirochaetaceae bacterium]
MKEVPVQLLRAGLVFSEPVYIEENNLLVPAGIAIRKKDLERLKTWGINTVKTDGQIVKVADSPSPAEAARAAAGVKAGNIARTASNALAEASPAVKDAAIFSPGQVQENNETYRSYIDLIEQLDAVFTHISANTVVEARSIDTITGLLLQIIREQRSEVIGFILGGEVSGHVLAKNSLNTAILSGLIALDLKLLNRKITDLITGALLHDTGMLRLPREILNKRGVLSESELQRMQAHPLYSYKIACKELRYPEDVGLIVIQHHERLDGEGYPRRLSGAQIDMGARIVSVTDAFEAMVSEKPYRNSMMGNQAIKNLLSDNTRRFDSDVLKSFIQTMGIYPIGSLILLNNGAIARVTDVQGDAPLRPSIRVLIDESGRLFRQDDGELIDLLTEKNLFIVRAIDPRELTKKYA